MNPSLPDVATEFGDAAERAFAALGGVDNARIAETNAGSRSGPIAAALSALGAEDLDPGADLDAAAAAGELCRRAGRVALAYPIVGVVMRGGADRLPLAVTVDDRLRVDHGDLFPEWRVTQLGGRTVVAGPDTPRLASKLGPFVTDLTARGAAPDTDPAAVALALTLGAWRILGSVERAVETAVEHVSDRVQFGQKLSQFQAVQFQLADAAVGVEGLRELCRFTLWRLFEQPSVSLVDALALRLHALDVARSALRTSQQLHGAAGLCDEYDVSILCRHVQPDLRIPFGAERTAAEMFAAVVADGFVALYPHGGSSTSSGRRTG